MLPSLIQRTRCLTVSFNCIRMIKNYLLIAYRNIWKRKTFSLIHILGLSIAFAASLLLFQTAMFDFSFNDFHVNRKHIYQIYREQHRPGGIENDAPMPVPLGPAALDELRGITRLTRYATGTITARIHNKVISCGVSYADPDFLQMFSFGIKNGSFQNVLSNSDHIVITRTFANRLYGTEEVVGKTIEMKTDKGWNSYIIAAVINDIPLNSSFKFDVLAGFKNFPGYAGNEDKWSNQNHSVFLQLKEHVSAASFEASAHSFVNKYFSGDIKSLKRDGAQPDAQGHFVNLKLLPLDEIHFSDISGVGPRVQPFFPWVLILLCAVILFIAGTNFVNLSLASAFSRSREIGVRKTFGAQKSQLVVQFWSEAFIICLLSLIIAVALVFTGLAYYKSVTGSPLILQALFTPRVLFFFSLIFLLTTLLAGGYPSWIMAHFNTIDTLHGKLAIGSKNKVRNMLTMIQFVIAIILITSTVVIQKQLTYIRNKPLGFNKAQVISIPIGSDIEPESALLQIRQRLAALPDVLSVTGTDINLGIGRDGSSTTSIMGFDYKNREIKTHWVRIDYDYLRTLDIPLVSGRDFSREFTTDTASALINEKMAAQLREKNPVGILLPLGDGHRLKVIGVVKDYNFKDLHSEIKPVTMVIRPQEWPISYIFVKVRPENLPGSMNKVTKIWKEINPQQLSELSFLDENTNNQYKKESSLSQIFMAGSGLAIFISCMGLFAMALINVNQRTKEIGIRKVLGATVTGLMTLLTKDFIRMVGISFVVAAPFTWSLMNAWLDDFAYRITISVWTLLSGGLLVLLVTLLTVSFHALKAAMTSPAKSIRTE